MKVGAKRRNLIKRRLRESEINPPLKTLSDIMFSSSEWMQQLCQQTFDSGGECSSFEFSDATAVTTGFAAGSSLSPSISSAASDPLAPKACISKPRRSRASKKTPVTLLNANATNFRALVQQFTGWNRTSISFGASKGPFNINFALGAQQSNPRGTSMMQSLGDRSTRQQYHQVQPQQEGHRQHHYPQPNHQEQESNIFSLDDDELSNNDFLLTSFFSRHRAEFAQGFAIEDTLLL